MITSQKSVSIPRIERYAADMLNGAKFPPIKVDGNILVDGHHRYFASLLTKKAIQKAPGTASKSLPTKPLMDLIFDTVSW